MKEKFIPPFRRFVIQNFPFIEADFDALTSYQLWSKVVEYLNKVIKSQNELTAEMQQYIDYINHYFDNLDVQEEIDNKLDEMAEDGTLEEIMASYLNTKAVFAFDSVTAMKEATNLINGSYAETYGYTTKGDGGSAKYKVRTITNEDVVDEMTLIALADETLVAELVMQNSTIYTKQFGIIGDGETDETVKLKKFFSVDTDKYVLNSGNILVDEDIDITSNSIIEFCEGCKLTRKTTDDNMYFMLNLVKVHDVVIKNASLVGDRDTHTGASGEWGYGIHIASSQNITVRNANIEKTWGDGIYIGYSYSASDQTTTKNILIDSCNILNCSRNGIAVCGGEDIVVRDCYIYGTNRIAPKSGIDIEPEGTEGLNSYLKNVTIENNTTEANGECGMCINIAEGAGTNVVIDGHKSYSDKHGVVCYALGASNSVIYSNGYIVKCNDAGLIISKSKGSKMVIENVTVDTSTKSDSEHGWNGALVIEATTPSSDGDLIVSNIRHIKTYSSLYEFADLICVRGDGTNKFDNLELHNISTNKLLCITKTTNTKLNNCQFTYKSSYYELDWNGFINATRFETDEALSVDTQRKIWASLADGEYELVVTNNPGYTFTVTFDSNLSVFGSIGAVTTLTATRYAYLKFFKRGNSIYLYENMGFTEA